MCVCRQRLAHDLNLVVILTGSEALASPLMWVGVRFYKKQAELCTWA